MEGGNDSQDDGEVMKQMGGWMKVGEVKDDRI